MPARRTGTVKWFNNAKGYGFIEGDDGPDIFVHYSQIAGEGFRTLQQGEEVAYQLKDGPKGPFAAEVDKPAGLVASLPASPEPLMSELS